MYTNNNINMTQDQLITLFEYIADNLLCSSETTPLQINDFL